MERLAVVLKWASIQKNDDQSLLVCRCHWRSLVPLQIARARSRPPPI